MAGAFHVKSMSSLGALHVAGLVAAVEGDKVIREDAAPTWPVLSEMATMTC